MRRSLLVALLAIALFISSVSTSVVAQPRPGCVCTAIYDPVCGSDGNDYSSPCQADCAGVTVAYPGICRDDAAAGSSDTPASNDGNNTPRSTIQLPGGININLPTVNRPAADGTDCLCSNVNNPVCGEDEQTYTNECQASCAGVLVASEGPCGAADETPSPAAAAAPRPPAAVVTEDGPAPAPAAAAPPAAAAGCVCAAVYEPVCGTDGKDYSSACEADCNGVAVWSRGSCSTASPPLPPAAAAAEPPPPAPAPTEDEPTAAAPAPTEDEPAAAAPAAAAAPKPQDSCVCPMIYAPVCTDKRVTRSNECVAKCQNERVISQGACNKPPVDEEKPAAAAAAAVKTQPPAATNGNVPAASPPAAEPTAAPAAAAEPPAATPVASTAAAAATTRTANGNKSGCGNCGDTYSPVCGTDRVTYSNRCEAECLNGATVAFEGVCASRDFSDDAAAAAANVDANATTTAAVRSSALSLRGGSSSSVGGVFGSLFLAVAALVAMLML